MSEPHTIEGEAVEVGTDLEPTSSANVALFGTSDPVGIVAEATRVADARNGVIQSKQLFTQIQGNKHVQVEGWQLLGSMLGVTAVCTETEQVEGGYRATVEARTADGRVVGRADALCTKTEKRGPWKDADDYARLSMAQTRATSKALKGPLGFVVSLAGYQTTPAEEMTFAEPGAAGDSPSPASSSPGGFASDKQRGLFEKLLREAGFNDDGVAEVTDWANSTMSGGRDQGISKAIDGLMDKSTRTEFADRLGKAAKEFASTLNTETPEYEPTDADRGVSF